MKTMEEVKQIMEGMNNDLKVFVSRCEVTDAERAKLSQMSLEQKRNFYKERKEKVLAMAENAKSFYRNKYQEPAYTDEIIDVTALYVSMKAQNEMLESKVLTVRVPETLSSEDFIKFIDEMPLLYKWAKTPIDFYNKCVCLLQLSFLEREIYGIDNTKGYIGKFPVTHGVLEDYNIKAS